MQRKPSTGLRPSLCLSRAEASQRLPGPRGLRGRCSTALGGGRSRTPLPVPSAAAAGGRGASGARCAWRSVREPLCEELSPEQHRRGGWPWLYIAQSHHWVPRLVPVPCAERAATALLLASPAPPSHLPVWLAPPVAPIPRACLQAVALRAGAVADAGLAKPVSPSDAHSAARGTARHFIILLETHTAPAQLEPRVLAINMLCPD